MARSNSHRGAFIFGSILGGAVGAVAALWNTPQSGYELRRKLGLGSNPATGTVDTTGATSLNGESASSSTSRSGSSLQDKAIGLLEQVAAPLVGVKLGHTANNSQPGAGSATNPVRETQQTVQVSRSTEGMQATEPVMPEGV